MASGSTIALTSSLLPIHRSGDLLCWAISQARHRPQSPISTQTTWTSHPRVPASPPPTPPPAALAMCFRRQTLSTVQVPDSGPSSDRECHPTPLTHPRTTRVRMNVCACTRPPRDRQTTFPVEHVRCPIPLSFLSRAARQEGARRLAEPHLALIRACRPACPIRSGPRKTTTPCQARPRARIRRTTRSRSRCTLRLRTARRCRLSEARRPRR